MDKFKEGYPWKYVLRCMQAFGWDAERDDGRAKIFVKRDMRMSAIRMSRSKWKLVVFKKNKTVDLLGVNDDPTTRLLICEFGLLWGPHADPPS